jgi:predicted aspartyl protease
LATLTDKLWQGGALVSIKVMQTQSQVESLKNAGLPFATPTVIIGLIDTGASRTVIESRIIKSMNLLQHGPVAIQTPSTGASFVVRDSYGATLVLGENEPDPLVVTVLAIEADIASQGFFALIGCDVLSRCVLTYDGPSGTYTLAW